jgi:raffinose synthase
MSVGLHNHVLTLNGAAVLAEVPAAVTLQSDPAGVGVFLVASQEVPTDRLLLPLGKPTVVRWTACHRYDPWWMKPVTGTGEQSAAIPAETQSLLAELADGRVAVFVPLLDGAFRCSLEGNAAGELLVVAESADPAVITGQVTGVFVAVGSDLYALLEAAARAVAAHLGAGRLRTQKKLPAFVEHFGWCTWDAFYQQVSHEKVREGLASFKAGGVEPRLLILDDGWQSVGPKLPHSDHRLTAFAANDKFPGDLAPTVQMAKQEFAVQHFLVWHAFQGYWGGVDPASFPTYHVRQLARRFSPGILQHFPEANEKWWGTVAGIVPADQIYAFYHAFHRHLRHQGVDGVKVDNQGSSEGLAAGDGGRVRVFRKYHEALEGSVHTHFAGAMLNCMSCGNDVLYQTLNSTLTRTSTDFWPKRPETHGLHLYANAQVCLWFGQFVHGDWDMFQSGHEWGPFHAAGRAVSGSPVYVSDKPGEHNFALLRKMVCSDGSILRCANPGLPTRDCVFANPLTEEVLLKIFNRVGAGDSGGGVVGVFNCRYEAEEAKRQSIAGHVSAADVVGLKGEEFLLYLHNADTIEVVGREDEIALTLGQGEWEIATFVPIPADGFAPLGLLDKLNTGQAVSAVERSGSTARVHLRDAGKFAAYCEHAPKSLHADGHKLTVHYADGLLKAQVPITGKPVVLTLEW